MSTTFEDFCKKSPFRSEQEYRRDIVIPLLRNYTRNAEKRFGETCKVSRVWVTKSGYYKAHLIKTSGRMLLFFDMFRGWRKA